MEKRNEIGKLCDFFWGGVLFPVREDISGKWSKSQISTISIRTSTTGKVKENRKTSESFMPE